MRRAALRDDELGVHTMHSQRGQRVAADYEPADEKGYGFTVTFGDPQRVASVHNAGVCTAYGSSRHCDRRTWRFTTSSSAFSPPGFGPASLRGYRIPPHAIGSTCSSVKGSSENRH